MPSENWLIKQLNLIAQRLDGREWNADTCDDIADILRNAGYRVRDVDTVEHAEREVL